jgi:hypothetical protein
MTQGTLNSRGFSFLQIYHEGDLTFPGGFLPCLIRQSFGFQGLDHLKSTVALEGNQAV